MKYILGLDMGTTSLGWAVVMLDKNNKPAGLKDMGVRIFPDGRDDKSKEPLSIARRIARGMRRNRDRRLSRRQRLTDKLVEYGFFPADVIQRKALEKLDPYELRARALDEKISSHELGRALFHINQRRGFKSNAKTDKTADGKELMGMKLAIEETKKAMEDSGARTYGEYLYKINKPGTSTQNSLPVRIRKQEKIKKSENQFNVYPDRALYLDEVEKILAAQGVSADISKDLIDIIFYQRKLRPQERGVCQFEKNEPRAFVALPSYQKFRTLQQINQLEIRDDTKQRKLEDKERALLIFNTFLDYSYLDKKYILTWAKIKKILGLPKGVTFNLESDEKRSGLNANRTGVLMSDDARFGKAWSEFGFAKQNEIISIIMDSREDEETILKLQKDFGLSLDQANKILSAPLEDSVGALSVVAADKITPFLEQGMPYHEAVEAAGYKFAHSLENIPDKYDAFMNPLTGETHPDLPYYHDAMPEKCVGGKINNPTVHIALNQLRRIVSDVVAKYGFPSFVSMELARNLNLGLEKMRELEKKQLKEQRDNERINSELARIGVKQNYDNRMKYKLWEDLHSDPLRRVCPFCGKQISEISLFTNAFEIEHLLPFSRTFLDGRNNKVISCLGCNRTKGNRTPFEAFGADEKEWLSILDRVDSFPNHAEQKRWKFRPDAMDKFKDESKGLDSALIDTQYMTKVAREYMTFVTSPKNVIAVKGAITAQLRHCWGLEFLANDETAKDRKDHRHHAIDAFVVACTTRQTLQNFYNNKYSESKQNTVPYDGFDREIIKQAFDEIVISYKPTNGLQGQLHEETYYGRGNESLDTASQVSMIKRDPVASLIYDGVKPLALDKILKNIENIVDQPGTADPIRKLLVGQPDEKYPEIIEKYFESRGMKKVRMNYMRGRDTMIELPHKYAVAGNNAYAEIYMPDRGKNSGKWQMEIIKRFDANQKNWQPKWRSTDAHAKLIMRLRINDMVAYDDKDGNRVITKVKKMTAGKVYLRPHQIAKEELDKMSWGASSLQMQLKNARKIRVNNLGRVFDHGLKNNEQNN